MRRRFGFLAGTVIGIAGALGGLVLGLAQPAPQPDAASIREMLRAELQAHAKLQSEDQAAAKQAIERLTGDIAALREQLTRGFVVHRVLEVTEPRVAHPLVEPKLMLSVEGLPGGSVIVNFADETRNIRVAQALDFEYGTCTCSLLLADSVRGRAVFHFGCRERDETAQPPESTDI